MTNHFDRSPTMDINEDQRYEFCKPQYESEIRTGTLGGRQIRLENLTPILTPEERATRKREIENRLYDVFVKYKGGKQK